ncbi:hypothetical protein CDV57_08404 [Aspergillus fumigatus]|nr:hypothetical protein CDV57_08404 [Aspergillus fumigatus]
MGKAGKTGENAVHEIMQLVADGLLLREPPKETEKAGETEENAPRWGHHPRKFRDFNDEHHLPSAWNIPEAHVEERFGRRIIQSIETDGDATLSSPGTQNGNSTGFGVPETLDVTMNDDEDEDGNGVTGLEELENVVKEEWATPGSYVLYW